MKCEHEGCDKEGEVDCLLRGIPPDRDYTYHYCVEHCFDEGFCYACGQFWSGVEGFDFNNPSHLCPNCLTEIEDDTDDGEDYP